MTCFITAVVDVPIDNFSGHLRHPVLCVFAKNIRFRDDGEAESTAISALGGVPTNKHTQQQAASSPCFGTTGGST